MRNTSDCIYKRSRCDYVMASKHTSEIIDNCASCEDDGRAADDEHTDIDLTGDLDQANTVQNKDSLIHEFLLRGVHVDLTGR